METITAKVNLDEERGRLKQKFAQLMDDDLLFEEGKKEERNGKQQARLRQTRRVLQKIVTGL